MNLKTHITVTLDEEGEPLKAYDSISEARDAVESDAYTHEDEVDYAPDIPLLEPAQRTEPADFGHGDSTGVQEL